jgi:hypothetical protein
MKKILTSNQIIEIQGVLEETKIRLQKTSRNRIKNGQTGGVVYTHHKSMKRIVNLMRNLEIFCVMMN